MIGDEVKQASFSSVEVKAMKIKKATLVVVFLFIAFCVFEAEGEGSRYYTDSINTYTVIFFKM